MTYVVFVETGNPVFIQMNHWKTCIHSWKCMKQVKIFISESINNLLNGQIKITHSCQTEINESLTDSFKYRDLIQHTTYICMIWVVCYSEFSHLFFKRKKVKKSSWAIQMIHSKHGFIQEWNKWLSLWVSESINYSLNQLVKNINININ